jgi:hypothetical protein
VRRSTLLRISLALLAVLAIAGVISLVVPLAACPSCSGAGKITVMGSHPEAMGSGASSGKLVDIGCPSCDGKARVTLYHRWTWEQPVLSSR